MKSLKFFDTHWWKDFKIFLLFIVIYIPLSGVIFAYLVMVPNELPLEYIHLFIIPTSLILFSVFLVGLFASLTFPYSVKWWARIFYINDFSYSNYRTKRGIIFMIGALAILLGILYFYFSIAGSEDPVKTLLLGWIALIFVRSAHYFNPRMGKQLGFIIISSLIPVGLFIAASNIAEIAFSFTFEINERSISWLYFISILVFQLGLEIIMEYSSIKSKEIYKRKTEQNLRSNWQDNPNFFKHK